MFLSGVWHKPTWWSDKIIIAYLSPSCVLIASYVILTCFFDVSFICHYFHLGDFSNLAAANISVKRRIFPRHRLTCITLRSLISTLWQKAFNFITMFYGARDGLSSVDIRWSIFLSFLIETKVFHYNFFLCKFHMFLVSVPAKFRSN